MTHPVSAAIDSALDLSVVGGYTRLGLAARRRLPGWPPDSPSGALVGTHVVVTGASSGLGEACVQMLHDLGAHVHLVVRDEAKGRTSPAASTPSSPG
ncbi:SDR family NAD(P)-dependent oxidoreductase [Janibacter melonis]|uniref:SDR family NAD(P)-dependent oxidoreductase n=1 Tax=Janibacter melonis TaxID=262209 RepID=UPI0020959C8E|nr:SDR family NAD(P)-dependent oxidoreductase [Janibacter melonis]